MGVAQTVTDKAFMGSAGIGSFDLTFAYAGFLKNLEVHNKQLRPWDLKGRVVKGDKYAEVMEEAKKVVAS